MVKMYIPLLALVGLASAKICVNNTVTIQLAARNIDFNISVPQNQYEVTAFTQFLARQGSDATAQAAHRFNNVNGTYKVSTQFCRPDTMNNTNAVVQVLTHGIGFDKT